MSLFEVVFYYFLMQQILYVKNEKIDINHPLLSIRVLNLALNNL